MYNKPSRKRTGEMQALSPGHLEFPHLAQGQVPSRSWEKASSLLAVCPCAGPFSPLGLDFLCIPARGGSRWALNRFPFMPPFSSLLYYLHQCDPPCPISRQLCDLPLLSHPEVGWLSMPHSTHPHRQGLFRRAWLWNLLEIRARKCLPAQESGSSGHSGGTPSPPGYRGSRQQEAGPKSPKNNI